MAKDDDNISIQDTDEYSMAKSYWTKIIDSNNYDNYLEQRKLNKEDDFSYSKYQFDFPFYKSEEQKQEFSTKPLILYIYMLGVLSIYMGKSNRRENIIITSPSLPMMDSKTAIVLFECFLKDEDSFSEYLNILKDTVVNGFKYQIYPVDERLSILEKENDELVRIYTQYMLSSTEFNSENDFQDLLHKYKIPFGLYYVNSGEDIKFNLYYAHNYYTSKEVQNIANRLIVILKQVSDDIGIKLSDIVYIGEQEKEEHLSCPDFTYQEDFQTIHELIEQKAQEFPDNIAVKYKNLELTYYELEHKANSFAHHLIDKYQVKNNDYISVVLNKDINTFIAILGILKAGAAYVPVDPNYPNEHIAGIIRDTDCKVVLANEKNYQKLSRILWECSNVKYCYIVDADNPYAIQEEESEIMDKNMWEHIGDNPIDEISGGAWINSYTREKFSKEEMQEYADNIYQKLLPYLNDKTRVLEIGCASGISMFRIAPEVGYYLGTDLSETILKYDQEKIERENITNIELKCVSAHEITTIGEKDFDIIILNSVCQCFNGYNYLTDVLNKACSLLRDKGMIFCGDIMDSEKKQEFIQSLEKFREKHYKEKYITKTDWQRELFIHKDYFRDLIYHIQPVEETIFSDKLHTIENELTKYRYDVILKVNKNQTYKKQQLSLNKQFDGVSSVDWTRKDRPNRNVDAKQVAYIIYTSGTTGLSKGVLVEHRNVVSLIQSSKNLFDFKQNDVWTMFHSLCFDFSVWEMYCPLLYGAKVIIIDILMARDLKRFHELMIDEKVTVLNLTPSVFYQLMELEEKSVYKYKVLRYIIFGGEALRPTNLLKWAGDHQHTKIINMYGITETTVHVTYKEIKKEDMELEVSNIGRAIPSLYTYVMDDNNHLVPCGTPGELCVGGYGVSRGYHKRDKLTKDKFIKNPYKPDEILYKSGDLVRMLPNRELEYFGRIDQQIKIRGYRVELGHIESVLIAYSNVTNAVAIVFGEYTSKQIYAYYTSHYTIVPKDIKKYLKTKLPEYMIPSVLIQVDEIPLNRNGKVDRKQLIEKHINNGVNQEYVAPRNELERKMVEIWKSILGHEKIGIEDNFFDIGGHSLRAIKMEVAFEQANIPIEYADIYRCHTIASLSEFVQESEKNHV